MANSILPVLSLLIFLPLAAGMGLFALKDERWIRHCCLAAALLELALSLPPLWGIDPASMSFIERHAWIPSLNMHYLLGIDGVSAPFLPLTALLNVCVIAASWTSVHHLPRLYFALLLWLEGATMGVFCALDLGLFFLFWELTLPPIYFLISLWGVGPQRCHAAKLYALTMLAGGVPLLLGIVLLALDNASESLIEVPAGLSFDYLALLETPLPLEAQSTIFLLLLLGFAVKAPLFPFHVWLPAAAMEGPAGVVALLTGLKLGLYGIIRYAVPLAPQAAQHWAGLMAGLGILGALYGALLALRETNLRRMLAYASVSHVGLVLIGVSAFNIQGIQGAVLQLFNFGIVSGGLFLLAGFLQHRLGSTELASVGGVARLMPLAASLFFILGLASIGVPGSNGFAAEHLIVIGAFKAHTGFGLAALLAAIFGAAYFLRQFRAVFLGPATRRILEADDLRPREFCIGVGLILMALGFGLFPQVLLDYSQKPLQAWVVRVQSGHAPSIDMAAIGPPASRTLPAPFVGAASDDSDSLTRSLVRH
jgi:NADH-quinone oxidoreductase subunit M